jgi:dTDP-4-amino-4,6-dideoxygalactose transaminase
LENLEDIQNRRKAIWNYYYKELQYLANTGQIVLPHIPNFASNNAHMFYIVCKNLDERQGLISALKENSILSVFHYLSLHKSPYYSNKHDGRDLPNSDFYSDNLLRLPMYYELTETDLALITKTISKFYERKL